MGWASAAQSPDRVGELAIPYSSQIDLRLNAHARTQRPVAVLARIENDLYRNPLHDFDVVASGILGRQGAEQWTGGAGNAVDVAPVGTAARVHRELHLL